MAAVIYIAFPLHARVMAMVRQWPQSSTSLRVAGWVWYEQGMESVTTSDPQPMAGWSVRVLTAVALGGVLGATGRWAIGTMLERSPGGWPWATLIVNLIGCAAIGLAARRVTRDTLAWAFVVTGLLGGFTTFSAFAIEVNDLVEHQRFGFTAGYLALTLAGGYLATAVAEGSRPET